MFQHGKLKDKSNKKPQSEKEAAAIQKQLDIITTISKDILKKRNSNDEENLCQKNLVYLQKAAELMTDSTTIWNFRKEILLNLKKTFTEEEYYKLLKDEIPKITALTMKNPKSYVLWNHREFCLKEAAIYEKSKNIYTTSLLVQDLAMCSLFLMKDDRNFHAWNYRLSLVLTIQNFFPEQFGKLLKQEIEYGLKKIKDSCSNFSAWHYRSKLLTVLFSIEKINWDTDKVLNYFEVDLDYLVKAMFTDPRDQSPWNYHSWLLNSFTPIYCLNYKQTEDVLEIELSENIYFEKALNCKYVQINKNFGNNFLSKYIKLDIKKLREELPEGEYYDLVNKEYDFTAQHNDVISVLSQLKTGVNGRITFTKVNQRLPSIKIFKDRVDIENNLNEWQRNFIEKQIEFVNKLIAESQGFLEFANHRRVQLHLILLSFDYFSSNRNEQSYNNIKSMVLKDYELLVNSSKRCSSMFSYFRDNSPQLKYKFN